ncbi:MAG TPA: hypothetical protein VMC09_11060 [Anaerolineales bacterium]|nr:hypothetical protein [Anaerolineales bacterium]
MDADLQFLVHFFNDREYLFKTISMAGASQVDEICDRISSEKGWYWPRFAPSERQDYLQRRRFVEAALYADYTREYGSLKERLPVYFCLYPSLTEPKALELARGRTRQGEKEPHVLLVNVRDIEDTANVTFTLNDSHTSYRKRTLEAGIECRGDANVPVVLPDHNRVFPFSMLEQVHQKYKAQPISYEIQVWDYQLLEKTRYAILGEEDPGNPARPAIQKD